MRRFSLLSMALVALGMAVPVYAQQVPAVPTVFVSTASNVDSVVARLMTFDRNHDGVLTPPEVPERMQPALFSRGTALNADAIRELAVSSRPSGAANGLQIGHYGFGDGFNFDTRLHIDGALDDLRLASDVREKAGTIARDVQSTSAERARAHLLTTMEAILTPEQLADFSSSLDGQYVTVRAVKSGETLIFGATAAELAQQQPVQVMLRMKNGVDLSSLVAKYALSEGAQRQADDEIAQFNLHRTGRLSAIDSQAIADALQGLLDDQQRVDLRAALERRPIVKQGQTAAVQTLRILSNIPNAPPLLGGVVLATGDNNVLHR